MSNDSKDLFELLKELQESIESEGDQFLILDPTEPVKESKCECGSASVGSSNHSQWCPLDDKK